MGSEIKKKLPRDLLVKQCSALYLPPERMGAIAQVDFREWILREGFGQIERETLLFQTNYMKRKLSVVVECNSRKANSLRRRGILFSTLLLEVCYSLSLFNNYTK